MLTQGSSARASAGGMQRGASAMAAAADTPISAFCISSSFPEPPNGCRVVAAPDTVSHFCDEVICAMSAMCSTAIRRADLSKCWGRRLSDPEVPTNLALRSVQGAGIAIALVSVQGVIAQGFVDASLVGSGIGDADTGIVGVCLCWWNAEGCQCYRSCRRHAH
jgi:hypothetical protein